MVGNEDDHGDADDDHEHEGEHDEVILRQKNAAYIFHTCTHMAMSTLVGACFNARCEYLHHVLGLVCVC